MRSNKLPVQLALAQRTIKGRSKESLVECPERIFERGYPRRGTIGKEARNEFFKVQPKCKFCGTEEDLCLDHKVPISKTVAIKEIKRCAGTQFDPQLVEIFLKIVKNKATREKNLTGDGSII